MQLTVLDDIETKQLILESKLRVCGTESILIEQSAGRILSQEIRNFRDSPPMDVSAMDGYACRFGDLKQSSSTGASPGIPLPVIGVATAGAPRLVLGSGAAIRIFTGAVVPEGADIVIPRERCNEQADWVSIELPVEQIKLGWNIRRRGENARAGDIVLEPGTLIDGPKMSSLVSMSLDPAVLVRKKVRIKIINTGDELLRIGEPIEPWQIRDSNGPLLECMLRACPWVECSRMSVADDLDQIQSAISKSLESSDAIILTGGVSMGDTDHVPAAVRNCGAEIVFHRLAIRPGAPILGAVAPPGKLVLGLPGNPVSVAVTFRRFGLPMLGRIAGSSQQPKRFPVELANPDDKTLHLVWYRLVQMQADGRALLLPNQGSGDLRTLGLSDGFIEIPNQTESRGTFRYYDWSHS
jgi:molybdopterin molybdotransferase